MVDAPARTMKCSAWALLLLVSCASSTSPHAAGNPPLDGGASGDALVQGDAPLAGDALLDGGAPVDGNAIHDGAGSHGDGGEVLPSPVVGDCSSLPASGTWQPITPPQVPLPGNRGTCVYGIENVVVDPVNLGTVYVGSCQYGIYKSTDCGSTWTHVNTGMNGSILDNSRQWTFIIDPTNPQVLYTNAGYNVVDGNQSGAFKSTNGGVDW